MKPLLHIAPRPYPGPAQTGAVLVTSLVILLVMTLVGVTALNTTILEEKMAGNLKERNVAFQAAESALRDAAVWIDALVIAPHPSDKPTGKGTDLVWTNGGLGSAPDPDLFVDKNPGTIEYGALTGGGDLTGVSGDPRFGVEEFQFIPDTVESEALATRTGVYHYAVTALGFGGTAQAQSMLQCFIDKRYR